MVTETRPLQGQILQSLSLHQDDVLFVAKKTELDPVELAQVLRTWRTSAAHGMPFVIPG